jgi:general secretion pathway protein M
MKSIVPAKQRWSLTAPRKQKAVQTILAIFFFAGIWWMALAPALATLRSTTADRAKLDTQFQQMLRLQARADAARSRPKTMAGDQRRYLELTIKTLGSGASVVWAGEVATVHLQEASGEAFAQWLAQLRMDLHIGPSEVHLVRNASGSWNGSAVIRVSAL